MKVPRDLPPFRRLVTTPQYSGGVACVTSKNLTIQHVNYALFLRPFEGFLAHKQIHPRTLQCANA